MANLINTSEYKDFILQIKSKIQSSQIKAALTVNEGLLKLYWDLGKNIVEKQKSANWGDGFISQINKDLKDAFPNMKGFSIRNIKYMRQWFRFWSAEKAFMKQVVSQFENDENRPQIVGDLEEDRKGQQLVAQLGENKKGQQPIAQIFQIPWGHNIAIISKVKNQKEALFYVNHTLENNWSRAVLVHQIESDLYHRKGQAVTNFYSTLPTPQSDLAQQLLKDPYIKPAMNSRNFNGLSIFINPHKSPYVRGIREVRKLKLLRTNIRRSNMRDFCHG